MPVAPHGEAHERVADEPEKEDDGVERDEDPLERRREDVRLDHVHVVVVADAVLIPALGCRRRRCRRRVSCPHQTGRRARRQVHG